MSATRTAAEGTSPLVGEAGQGRAIGVRRLWLPWRPRLRLILAYPRGWHYVNIGLARFDDWVTRRFTGRARPLGVAIFLAPYIAVRFIGLVAVLEVTIVAFAASVYLVWAEWLLLVLALPFVLAARVAHVLPWPLAARAGEARWTAHVAGWHASGRAAVDGLTGLRRAAAPGRPVWTAARHRARIWM